MVPSEIPDPGPLTRAQAEQRVDDVFVRPNEGGADVPLTLIAVQPLPRDPRAQAQPADRPFSLLFRGPLDLQLTQGMHDLQNEHLPLPGLFLVPVGRQDDGYRYEAVFS